MPIESPFADIGDLDVANPITLTDDARDGAAHIRGLKVVFKSLEASGGAAQLGTITSGTGATARTIAAKLADVLHPKDFGAVGDGSTDDKAAIIAACVAGAAQKKPVDGGGLSYGISGTMTLTAIKHLCNLTLVQTNPSAATCKTLYINNLDDFTLENIRVDRGGGSTAGALATFAGIYIKDGSRFSLRGIEVFNGGPGSGIVVDNNTDFTLVDCYVRDHLHDIGATDDAIQGIWINDGARFSISSCRVEDLLGNAASPTNLRFSRGFSLSGCSVFSITNCVATGVDQGFDFTGTVGNTAFTISNCSTDNTGTYGFKFANSSYQGTVAACMAKRSGYIGFVVQGMGNVANPLCRDITFSNCRAIDTGSNGIWVANQPQGFRVMSNATVDASYPRGIRFVGCDAVDTQGSPTMVTGFASDVPAKGPIDAGYLASDSNTCVNCNVRGQTGDAFSSGINFPYAVAVGAADTGSANTSTWTAVDLGGTEIADPSALHSTTDSSPAIFPKSPGMYVVMGTASFAANATGTRKIRFTLDGVAASPEFSFPAHATLATTVQGMTAIKAEAGKPIRMEIWQNSGGALNFDRSLASLSIVQVG